MNHPCANGTIYFYGKVEEAEEVEGIRVTDILVLLVLLCLLLLVSMFLIGIRFAFRNNISKVIMIMIISAEGEAYYDARLMLIFCSPD